MCRYLHKIIRWSSCAYFDIVATNEQLESVLSAVADVSMRNSVYLLIRNLVLAGGLKDLLRGDHFLIFFCCFLKYF